MIATWLFELRGRVPPEYSAEYSKMLGSSIQGIHEYSAWIPWILWLLHWILRLNTLITPLNTLFFLFSGFFWHFLCILFCGNDFCQLLKNIHFLTQLNTPPEYPEYSNRAFSLNTPGDPPSDEFPNSPHHSQIKIERNFIITSYWLHVDLFLIWYAFDMLWSCAFQEVLYNVMLLQYTTIRKSFAIFNSLFSNTIFC